MMDVLVPFAANDPKTRLSGVFDERERNAFARACLLDVCETVRTAGGTPTVMSTAPFDCEYPVVVDERPLTDAVNARLDVPVGVVMADLPLANERAVRRLLESDADVTIAPGLRGGTNALLVSHPEFHVDYHGASVRDHRRIADRVGATVAEVDSFRLAVDVDEPPDLAEVLLHGEGRARQWLLDKGFELVTSDGRVDVRRS